MLEKGIPVSDDPVFRPDVARWLRERAEVPGDPILQEMHDLARERHFPIIGPEVGRFCRQTAMMIGAKRIFEMGSGFGYSTLWFARGAGPGGKVWHTDGDPANSELARSFLSRAGVADRVDFQVGDARDILERTPGTFDVIFCDIDKDQYPSAFGLIRDRVRPGGAVIIDNLIWSGLVAAGDNARSTQGVAEYIRLMWEDDRFLSSLLPIRDGVGFSLRVR